MQLRKPLPRHLAHRFSNVTVFFTARILSTLSPPTNSSLSSATPTNRALLRAASAIFFCSGVNHTTFLSLLPPTSAFFTSTFFNSLPSANPLPSHFEHGSFAVPRHI